MISTITVQNILFSIKDSWVGDDDFQASWARRYAKLIDRRARRRKRKKERKKGGETVEKLTENGQWFRQLSCKIFYFLLKIRELGMTISKRRVHVDMQS